MIKVLKSFDSAHSAVSWMTQNRIAGTSIETTGTLKSTGMGRIPSGNYHVVLKSDDQQVRGNTGITNQTLLEFQKDPVDVTKPEVIAGHPYEDLIRRTLSNLDYTEGADPLTAAKVLFQQGRKRTATDTATLSISHKDLVSVITKSVMNVLKNYNPPGNDETHIGGFSKGASFGETLRNMYEALGDHATENDHVIASGILEEHHPEVGTIHPDTVIEARRSSENHLDPAVFHGVNQALLNDDY
jgi:hypothetical protein